VVVSGQAGHQRKKGAAAKPASTKAVAKKPVGKKK